MDTMKEIRKKAKTEEIDYIFLMDCLSSYKRPRQKLSDLLKTKQLLRIKKGLYVFGKEFQLRPYCLEVLANLIYGPSYLSFEYALAYYGLIPEKVTRITSACLKRIKYFKTPVGEFVYYYVSPQKFAVGITWKSIDEYTSFLFATKEKALADYLAQLKPFKVKDELESYLIEGMRIEASDLYALKPSLLRNISYYYQNKNVDLLCEILKK